MSWTLNEDGSRRRGQPVTSQDLEERINMYIGAMDKATSLNDESMSAQLQRDIQHLVDLMEKVSTGQSVMDTEVPPPLVMTPIHDAVANPLGELSSRLSDYHKALYFAEEELSENRLEKIQTLQKGLQTIHSLQKKAQAGFPVKEDEIPGPVTIPDDSEFDNDALNTITTRLDQYKSALSFCEKSTGEDRRRIPKLQSCIRKLNFLLTRAQVKRPVWRKDIPPEFDYHCVQSSDSKSKSENVAKMTLQARALQHRVSKCTNPTLQQTKDSIKEGLEKLITKWTELKVVNPEDSANLAAFTAMLDNLEMTGDSPVEQQVAPSMEQELKTTEEGKDKTMSDLALIDARIKEYKTSATKATHEGNLGQAIKDLKVVKGLQPMRDSLEKGEKVDMTLVPPPPQDTTSMGESPPAFISIADSSSSTTTTTTNTSPVPQSAHAQVSPFNIRPTTETAEDKLARKLTSFLEDEGEMKSFNSASSSSPSSLESDLSPIHRPGAVNDKVKTEGVEKRAVSDTKVTTPLPSNIESSHGSPAHSQTGSSHSEDNAATIDMNRSEQAMKETVSNPSTDPNMLPTNTICTSLPIESELVNRCDEDKSLTAEREDEKYSVDGGEKNSDSSNAAMDERQIENDHKELPKQNVEGTTDNQTSPSKVSGSKNPLDRIGFLPCQDVPLSEKERVQYADAVSSSTKENNAVCEMNVTNDAVDKHKEHPQNEKEVMPHSSPDSTSSNDNVHPASQSSTSEANETLVAKGNLTNDLNLPTYITDTDREESVIPTQGLQNQYSCLDNSSASSLPYSVNNHTVTTNHDVPNEKKNDMPFKNNTQRNDNGPILASGKSNVRDFYSLSGDCNNFDDVSDMQEFQELMDSMSIASDTPSLTTGGGATGVQSQDSSESSKAASHQQNSALYNNSIISESTPMSSGYVNQKINHTAADLSLATSSCSNEGLLKKNTVTQLNAQPFSTLNTDMGSSVNQELIHQESFQNYKCSVSQSDPFKQTVQLTGLETLKYDLLLTEEKGAKREAGQLQEKMDLIRNHLKRGGRKEWENYKSCLETEWQSLNDGIRDCGEKQEWDTYKYLNNKRMLNERELCYLKQHIEEVKE